MSQELSFDGSKFVQELDGCRLTGQIARVYAVIKDEKERTVKEIQQEIERRFKVVDPETSISAQLRNLRKPEFGEFQVESYRKGEGGLFVYFLVRKWVSDELAPKAVTEMPKFVIKGNEARLTVEYVPKPEWFKINAELLAKGFDYRGMGLWKK